MDTVDAVDTFLAYLWTVWTLYGRHNTLWTHLRLNGVQEVPSSNLGAPTFYEL